MKGLLTGVFLMQLLIVASAQTPREKATALVDRAVFALRTDSTEQSLRLLEEAKSVDKDYIEVDYVTALIYQYKKQYNKSLEILKKLPKHPEVSDKAYQLLGDNYKFQGDNKNALKYFELGLKEFPASPVLFLEKGIVLADNKNYDGAVEAWESGVRADPNFPSNYYYLSTLFSKTNEKIWAIYYGELFMNLEPPTVRRVAISKLLYETYHECLGPVNNKWELHFSERATHLTPEEIDDLNLPFETVHNLAIEKAFAGVPPEFSIANVVKMRRAFLPIWNKEYAAKYPNDLFKFHQELADQDMLESYFYAILKEGDNNEFNGWLQTHRSTFKLFVDWITLRPFRLTPETAFIRTPKQ